MIAEKKKEKLDFQIQEGKWSPTQFVDRSAYSTHARTHTHTHRANVQGATNLSTLKLSLDYK